VTCATRGRILVAAALLGLLAAALAPAESPPSSTTRTRAVRLVRLIEGGRTVTHLTGDVLIERDSLTVASDSAVFYDEEQKYDFFGRVRLTRGRAVLTCDTAAYDGGLRSAEFRGNVRLVDGDVTATSTRGELRDDGALLRLIGDARLVDPAYVVFGDTIVRRDEGGRGEAEGSVRIVDPGKQSLVTGGRAVFDRADSVVVVDRSPHLTTREAGGDPLDADARVMTFHRAEDRVVMVDSVVIRQGRTRAYADTAYVEGREHVLLRGSPRVQDGDGSTMTADGIEFFYEDGELARVLLAGTARVEDGQPAALAEQYRGLPARNELTGDVINIHFTDGEPRVSVVVGGARSIYVPEGDREEIACNNVAGDTILLAFRDRKVDRVDVRGSMSGRYAFVRLGELDDLAGRTSAVLDSLAPGGLDSLLASLPDSLRAGAAADSLLAAALATAAGRDGMTALAAALGDSTGGAALVARALAAAATDTLADGRRALDFEAASEKVDYSGRTALFELGRRRIAIAGNSRMVYGSMDLKAGRIRLDLTDRVLYAAENPLLIDSGQKMAGDDMGYDFEHRSGAVLSGATAMDGFFYVGDEIKRFDDGMLKIRSGRMTSCDLSEPHYHFWADKMMVRPGDKMVAKPIVLKIGRVPLFALPFYFKSLESGRRSGILFPSFNFGWSQRTGRYIRDWGYYWAASDYTDFTFRGDYNERREFTWQLSNRYIKRYSFQGDASFSRRLSLGGEPRTREWQFQWSHRQDTLFDAYQFQTSLNMSSRTISRVDLLNDVGSLDQISGQQTSTARISRNWSLVSASLNFKRDEFVNREDGDPGTNNLVASQAFPNLSLNFKSTSLLPQLRPGRKGGFPGDILRSTYLRNSWSFNTQTRTYESTDNTVHAARGSASLDFKQQRLLFFTASTGVSASHGWTRDTTEGTLFTLDPVDSNYVAQEVRRRSEATSSSLSINSSLNTTLYGVMRPPFGGLSAVRHTLRLGISHQLAPAIAGHQGRSESYGLSLGNRFDVKLRRAVGDTATAERKLDGVLDWGLSSGYAPGRAPGQRWSVVNSSLTVKPGQAAALKITINQTFDPATRRVTGTRFTYGYGFSGRMDTGGAVAEVAAEKSRAIDRLGAAADSAAVELLDEEMPPDDRPPADHDFPGFDQLGGGQQGEQGRDLTEGGRFLPWRVNSSLSYSRNHLTDDTTARLGLSANLSVTRNWDLAWRGTYDFEDGTLTSQSWNLVRDLHCWEMRFSRTVSAVDSQFGFIISLKAIPDVKVTRGKSDLVGGYGQMTGGIF
jgi:lipopolysaccharide assembly outer membrane protein LptD (OstA)